VSALAAALDLHRRGYSLLPLESRGKRPHAAALKALHDSSEWGPLRNNPAGEPVVRAWLAHDPAANLGVIITPGLVVVDVDDPAGFDLLHPATPTVRSARGWHLYFPRRGRGSHERPVGRGPGDRLLRRRPALDP
jgi:bifunctional DNA primase/polymerase-like protein